MNPRTQSIDKNIHIFSSFSAVMVVFHEL